MLDVARTSRVMSCFMIRARNAPPPPRWIGNDTIENEPVVRSAPPPSAPAADALVRGKMSASSSLSGHVSSHERNPNKIPSGQQRLRDGRRGARAEDRAGHPIERAFVHGVRELVVVEAQRLPVDRHQIGPGLPHVWYAVIAGP